MVHIYITGMEIQYVIFFIVSLQTAFFNLHEWLTLHLSITLAWSPTWCTKFLFIHIQYIY